MRLAAIEAARLVERRDTLQWDPFGLMNQWRVVLGAGQRIEAVG